MNEQELEKLRYPVGRFRSPAEVTPGLINEWIATIAELPAKLRSLLNGLNDNQLDTPYRPGGWKIRQVVHHLADSHINSLCRFKLALTEDKPTIKPYMEERWAELADYNEAIDNALDLIQALHHKWVVLLGSLSPADWQKSFFHPETGKESSLDKTLALYAWHCEHHYAHIANLKKEKGW
jgi:hypothetical protein